MKKILKIALWSVLGIVVVLIGLMAGFMYKVKNGFPVSYETEAPNLTIPAGQTSVLLFSKATGFRHGESIEAGKKVFAQLAIKNNWFLYDTEDGGVFNPDQLAQFDAVIFNNSTGRVLNDEQQQNLEDYVTNGGSLIGIHGAGDNSHHWDWYTNNLMGATFSHHPLNPQLQETTVMLEAGADSVLAAGLAPQFTHIDEWYVFFENPRKKGFNILYTIDGDKILPSGNMLWMTDKDFGMGKDHPVAWWLASGRGRTFYTSMGHNSTAWQQPAFVKMLENAVER
ncbi:MULTISPECIES: ThuA domain-containing protein [unclassified Imperialibacter]|uniref:ThuA domain-containing protein n=1 Tax=unclassified Imperialibacter TaxID=2629706 RepID=UPI00125501AC|nr:MULTISPECIES: ThuA domain-containing protein [unclassified Imperialibacter]CAD5250296.1 Crp/Fnr family transcriptional regulator [Imperialibacter sp. 75]CAD5287390.1 Crp/Fnr family transcriptional regulator [Imperialibacter sp. 89]VVT01623.1 Crp/Fnr family transcriptional regulator [Imperialibacter sp. EC-SDR9]